jgi:hypothetical protein
LLDSVRVRDQLAVLALDGADDRQVDAVVGAAAAAEPARFAAGPPATPPPADLAPAGNAQSQEPTIAGLAGISDREVADLAHGRRTSGSTDAGPPRR